MNGLPSQLTRNPSSFTQGGAHTLVATDRYEETMHQLSQLESAKHENEALKQRIRELERRLSSNNEQNRESLITSQPAQHD